MLAVCSGGLQSIPSIFQTCEGVRKERAIGGGDFRPLTVSLLKPLTTPCRNHSIGSSAPACHGVNDLLLTVLIAMYFCSPYMYPCKSCHSIHVHYVKCGLRDSLFLGMPRTGNDFLGCRTDALKEVFPHVLNWLICEGSEWMTSLKAHTY